MELTEKLSLKKPGLEDYVKISDLNENMDILDGEVGSLKEGSTVIEELETTNKTLSGAINEINDDLGSHKADEATLSELGHIKLQEDFIELPLENGWSKWGSGVSIAKNDLGMVTLSVQASCGETTIAKTNITTLPNGYRPKSTMVTKSFNNSTGDLGIEFYINASGLVRTTEVATEGRVYMFQLQYFSEV